MNRRGFLKRMTGLPAVLLVPELVRRGVYGAETVAESGRLYEVVFIENVRYVEAPHIPKHKQNRSYTGPQRHNSKRRRSYGSPPYGPQT